MPIDMPMSFQFFAAVAKDVAEVSKVDATQFANAIDAMQEVSGFLGSSKAFELISEHVTDSTAADAIRNLVFALHDWVNEQGATIPKLGESFKEALQDDKESKVEFENDRFDECLKALAGPFEGVQRQANATRVASMSGSRLENVTFVSDLRTVYRQPERDVIEGFIPMTTIVINSEDSSGEDSQLELIVSLSELESIIDEANKAKGKINQLVEFSTKAGVEIPSLDLTRSKSKTNE